MSKLYLIEDVDVEFSGRQDGDIEIKDILFATTNEQEFLKIKSLFTNVLKPILVRIDSDGALVLNDCEENDDCDDEFRAREIRFTTIELGQWLNYTKSAKNYLMDLLNDMDAIELNPDAQAKRDREYELYKKSGDGYEHVGGGNYRKKQSTFEDGEEIEYEALKSWLYDNRYNVEVYNPHASLELLKD